MTEERGSGWSGIVTGAADWAAKRQQRACSAQTADCVACGPADLSDETEKGMGRRMKGDPLIVCEHVDVGYEDQDAVIDVDMEIDQGDDLCIVGENGSGKSTLMKGILGLLKPTGGTLTLDEDLKRTGIGYLPQQTVAQRDFPATVYEVVRSGCLSRRGMRPFYTRKEEQLALECMEKLKIGALKDHCYRELSGGQQQRVLIARALCATSKLLVLDEPVTGLDPSAIQELYQILQRLNREDGVTILMVSHDIRNVVGQADKILHLGQRVLFYGSAEAYRKSGLGQRFLGTGK